MLGLPATILLILGATGLVAAGRTKEPYSVACTDDAMLVRVTNSPSIEKIELTKWGELPGCQPTFHDAHYLFNLPLDDRLECGTTRVKNKLTGDTVYYHRISVTSTESTSELLVKCRIASEGNSTSNSIVKRDVWPPQVVEPDYIEITSEVSGTAPIPILNVGVRQDGNKVEGQINVRPGTPLTMEVYLDNASDDIYGILMSYMEVTDTQNKKETIIFNGCSVDPVLFDNFMTEDGDLVSAKFRAFKFPESSYVLFRGTVDVCLDKCQGIACSNGQLGYGRRRRGVDSQPADPNKIFEVTMMTYLKVEEEERNNGKLVAFEEDITKVSGLARDVVDDLSKGMSKSMVAVERAVEDLPEEPSYGVSADYISELTENGNEPTFIYFNDSHKMMGSLCVILTALFFLFAQ